MAHIISTAYKGCSSLVPQPLSIKSGSISKQMCCFDANAVPLRGHQRATAFQSQRRVTHHKHGWFKTSAYCPCLGFELDRNNVQRRVLKLYLKLASSDIICIKNTPSRVWRHAKRIATATFGTIYVSCDVSCLIGMTYLNHCEARSNSVTTDTLNEY